MSELNLKAQTLPGAVGTSLSIIWMTYGGWINIVPPDLDQTRELALTAALGVVFTALANVVRVFLPKEVMAPLTGERRQSGSREHGYVPTRAAPKFPPGTTPQREETES